MEALRKLDLKNVVFLDIETASLVEELEMNTPLYDSFKYSFGRDKTDLETIAHFPKEAALHAEFARIVCITVGIIRGTSLRTKTYADSDERTLLLNFQNDLGQITDANAKAILGGHAIKGFDAPFIAKRCLINQVTPHKLLDVFGKKPWNVDDQMIDTKDLWQGTGFRASSLINIAVALGVPSPKSDISGAEVGGVYFGEGATGLKRIIKYCEQDVLAVANVCRRIKFEPLLALESSDKVEVEKLPVVINLANGGNFEKREQKELTDMMKLVDLDDLDAAFEVLEAIAAKKGTKLTKTYMNHLRKQYETV